MSAPSAYSAGARYERAAVRKYLERMTTKYPGMAPLLQWIKGRQKRYAKKPGGL